MNLRTIALAAIGSLLAALPAAGPAQAGWDRHHGSHWRGHHHWRPHPHWRPHYAPPRVYYAPPPAYHYAPPVQYVPRGYYPAPGLTFGFVFR